MMKDQKVLSLHSLQSFPNVKLYSKTIILVNEETVAFGNCEEFLLGSSGTHRNSIDAHDLSNPQI